jgi:hypothetical protein
MKRYRVGFSKTANAYPDFEWAVPEAADSADAFHHLFEVGAFIELQTLHDRQVTVIDRGGRAGLAATASRCNRKYISGRDVVPASR